MESVSEEWASVKDKPEYEVSKSGKVRSRARSVICKNGVVKPVKAKMLSVCIAQNGYPVARLSDGVHYVHTLILEAFVGPRPDGCEALHRDGNRLNSTYDNLHWGTPKENQNDRARHGTSNRGERCAAAKLTADEVSAIFRSSESGCELSRRYGVAQQTICNIRKGRRWQHLNPAGN